MWVQGAWPRGNCASEEQQLAIYHIREKKYVNIENERIDRIYSHPS